MKFRLLAITSAKELWLQEAKQKYIKKITAFVNFEVLEVKPKSHSRAEAQVKKQSESKKLLSLIEPSDFVCLLDETGQLLNSLAFSKQVDKLINSGKQRVIFIIGGAYGVSEEVQKRADLKLSLSKLTVSHQVAQLVCLEQIYRAFTIQKGLPYHNK